jgi:CO/xanthine dehydrogenase FAD-binding subunit
VTELLLPRSAADIDARPAGTSLLAGGTDVLVQRRAGRPFGTLIDLTNLADAPAPVVVGDDAITMSALAPIGLIATALGAELPGLRAAVAAFASAQIRNRATLGGNLANASPAADCVPPLVAAGARLQVRGAQGTRTVPVDAFALGPGRTVLGDGEWIVTVTVPRAPQAEQGFRKIAGRQALAISIVSLAWQWRRDADGTLRDVRLAAGAVAPTVVRCPRAEAVLEAQQPSPEVATAAAGALAAEVSPIDDLRGGAEYRRAALAGALLEALGRATTNPATAENM